MTRTYKGGGHFGYKGMNKHRESNSKKKFKVPSNRQERRRMNNKLHKDFEDYEERSHQSKTHRRGNYDWGLY